jgi:predicted TIM-barrel fold metal-dependent hydrolase
MWVEERIQSYRQRKADLPWLDAHAWIGVGPENCLRPVTSVDQTAELLGRYGIRRAIVAHTLARDLDPATGNRLLVESIAGRDAFWGAAVLAPDDASPADFRARLQSLIAAKVRMVRVFPRRHNWLLAEWCSGPWLGVLEEMRLPLAVWHTEASWDEVAAVCAAHPQLPVIVEGPNRKLLYHNRVYYRLLEQFPNFHLEIHNLVGYLGLDDAVRRFGSRQLLFGTYLPYQDPNVPMMLVTDGQIAEQDQRNIAGENMARLIASVENAR